MATIWRFRLDVETGIRQIRDETVVSDVCALVRVIWFVLPAHLFRFFQIFKVALYLNF
jgi:hypothetical protein